MTVARFRGRLAWALAAVLCTAPLAAQSPVRFPPPRVSVTPFLGYSFGFEREGTARIDVQGRAIDGAFEASRGGAAALGLEAEVPIQRLLSVASPEGVYLIGSMVYTGHGSTRTGVVTELGEGEPVVVANSGEASASIFLAKLGLSLQVPGSIPVGITVAPALVRIIPRSIPDDPLDRTRASNHAGVNLGLVVHVPTMLPRLSLRVGVEDYLILDHAELGERVDRTLAVETGLTTRTRVPVKLTHVPLLGIGLAFRP